MFEKMVNALMAWHFIDQLCIRRQMQLMENYNNFCNTILFWHTDIVAKVVSIMYIKVHEYYYVVHLW